ncbi:MAG: hypothetical protein OEZ22_01880 [Spirochaetia bacterium]|nr:hypothetical protein [Spirochaetia bacterium]
MSEKSEKIKTDVFNLMVIVFLAAIVNLFIFAYLWRNMKISVLRYEISKLKNERRDLFLESENLRLKIAEYSTPSRIEKLFREKYGYVPLEVGKKISSLKLAPIQIKD